MRLPADLDARSLSDLRALVIALVVKGTELERTVAAQRDEIARLKGKGRPQIKPSGMEKASQALTQERATGKRRRKRAKSADLTIHEERIIKAGPVPPGSRFKAYQTFVVQDLVLRPHVVRLRRERWLAPDGQTIMAAMPSEIVGHFGLGLRRFVLAQYHQGQVTIPRLLEQLSSLGLRISKRQLVRFLIAGQDGFVDEARAVLRAGLSGAAWISVDDTGARHRGANQVCTQIGNDHFTWFGTTASKSRLNFLKLLRAGHTDYVINPEALAYMRSRALAGPVIAKLASHPTKHFAGEGAWRGHLDRLELSELTGQPRSGADCHRRGAVGRDQGPRLPARLGGPSSQALGRAVMAPEVWIEPGSRPSRAERHSARAGAAARSAHVPCVLALMRPPAGEPITAPVVARGVAVRGSVGVVARAVAVAVGRVGIGGRIIAVAVRRVPVTRSIAVARSIAIAVVGARGGSRCEPEQAAGDRTGRDRAAIVGPAPAVTTPPIATPPAIATPLNGLSRTSARNPLDRGHGQSQGFRRGHDAPAQGRSECADRYNARETTLHGSSPSRARVSQSPSLRSERSRWTRPDSGSPEESICPSRSACLTGWDTGLTFWDTAPE